MNTRKYNAARKAADFGDKTFRDILKVLERYTDLEKLTGKQIGELVRAMYASNLNGQNQVAQEYELW